MKNMASHRLPKKQKVVAKLTLVGNETSIKSIFLKAFGLFKLVLLFQLPSRLILQYFFVMTRRNHFTPLTKSQN